MKYLLIAVLVFGGFFYFMNGAKSYNLDSAALQAKLAAQEDFVLLDVRTQEEYDQGHLPKAILLPYDEIDARAEQLLLRKDQELVIYCRSGRRSAIAAEALVKLGYQQVEDFGGISRWQGPLEK